VACPISIETLPILHFYPGAKILQITSTGCNFSCPGCISTVLVEELDHASRALQQLSPEEVIDRALATGCRAIAYVMNDPLAAFPCFLRLAQLAREKQLLVGCASNAYFTEESLEKLLPLLDFINVGIKGFTDQAYQACGVSSVAPVLRNVKILHQAGVHVEISAILNANNQTELDDLADFLAHIDRSIPLQVMRFLPFESAAPSLEPRIQDAELIVTRLRSQLDYVYLFNTPGTDQLSTHCSQCGEVQLQRDFYGPMGAKLKWPAVDGCDHPAPVKGNIAAEGFNEGDFEGGYPFTRALEIVEAMLIAMGVKQKRTVVKAWEEMLKPGGLQQLQRALQQPHGYIGLVRQFGSLVGLSSQAELLAHYLEERLLQVDSALTGVTKRPRVYYAMGKPLFYIKGGRMENRLVERAGGQSCNNLLDASGRPGGTISTTLLQQLNPQAIFISGFISQDVSDFSAECLSLGLDIEAVNRKQIYCHPAPGWDFGSPRWILGLLHMATCLHPQTCDFDVHGEAENFYQQFYGCSFNPAAVNRSLSKPDCNWRWEDVID
jgi:pyruvate-formate lyase-activating enzyme